MVSVKFLPKAEQDLFALSEEIQDEILDKVQLLTQFPQLGPAMEGAYRNYRYFLAGKNQYRIIYRIISPQQVEIAYIRHCRRQLGLRIV